MSATENKKFPLTGKAYYTQLRQPNQLSGKYQMDLSVDEDTTAKLKTIGVDVKNKDDGRGNFVTLKANAENKDGTTRTGPRVLDADKNEIPEDVLIGNGSEVKVIANAYEWKFKGKTGVGLGVNIVQVLDLVPYIPQDERLLDN